MDFPAPGDRNLALNLGGILPVLRAHWRRTPYAFLRELLARAARAIEWRGEREPRFPGRIRLRLGTPPGVGNGDPAWLLIEDNGLGLTPDEVRQSLATVGGFARSSFLPGGASDRDGGSDGLIGRLGLGVVACFTVAEEIRVLTRSGEPGVPAIEWAGRADGSCELRRIEGSIPPGTQIYLRPRSDCEDLFRPAPLWQAVAEYGQFLPHSLVVVDGGHEATLNGEPPWSVDRSSAETWRTVQLAAARRLLGEDFLDAVPIRSRGCGIDGVALVLARPARLLVRPLRRVYRNGLLLAEDASNLLPQWACFVACVVNARDVCATPFAAGLAENSQLAAARRSLWRSLAEQFALLAETEPERWQRIAETHVAPFQIIAAEDEEFSRLFIDLLPFDSTAGRRGLRQLARQHWATMYTPTPHRNPSLVLLARTLGLGIVFPRDARELTLLRRAAERRDPPLREFSTVELARHLNDLSGEQMRAHTPFLELADEVLAPFACAVELKHFGTTRVPALYVRPTVPGEGPADAVAAHQAGEPLRARARHDPAAATYAQLWLNYDHPVVRLLAAWLDRPLVHKAVKLLYAHAVAAHVGSAQLGISSGGPLDGDGTKALLEGLSAALGESPADNPRPHE